MDLKVALKRFYEQVGEKYHEEEHVYKTLHGRLRKKFILEHISRFSGSLIDVGCNRGIYLIFYMGGPRYGVDLSISILRKIPLEYGIHRLVADAERLYALKSDSFDNVLCSEVLEHCLCPGDVFQGLAHVVKPGGNILLTTPNYKRNKPGWIELGTLEHYGVESDCNDGYYHTAFRPEELEKLARQSGLEVIEAGTIEKEVKYAAKVPAALLLAGRLINRVFRSARFDALNQTFFNKLTLWIYYFCHFTGLEKIFMLFFSEGVRSFIRMRKNPD